MMLFHANSDAQLGHRIIIISDYFHFIFHALLGHRKEITDVCFWP